jgi:hydroxypyruvate isomerase
MQRMEGELAKTLEQLMPRIAHIQVAGNPNRTEPDRGEINYDYIFDLIDRLGYGGWIGAEYKPAKTTVEGLAWLKKWSR